MMQNFFGNTSHKYFIKSSAAMRSYYNNIYLGLFCRS